MKILRLLVTKKCNRACPGCCNKQYDLDSLEVESDYTGYDLIILTGGEPMLFPDQVCNLVDNIRKMNDCPIYMYTAHVTQKAWVSWLVLKLDGLTLTLHEQSDVEPFIRLVKCVEHLNCTDKSLRLNVFSNVTLPKKELLDLSLWEVKSDIEWIEDCPLPENETFKRIDNLF